MIISIEKVPEKYELSGYANRLHAVEEFLKSGYECAEYQLEEGEAPRRVYNGVLMAVRRRYPDRVRVCWRHGRIFLIRRG